MKTGQQTRRTLRLAFSFPMLAALGLGGPVLAASKTAFVVVGSGLETILNTRRALFAEMIGKLDVVVGVGGVRARRSLPALKEGVQERNRVGQVDETVAGDVAPTEGFDAHGPRGAYGGHGKEGADDHEEDLKALHAVPFGFGCFFRQE